LPIVQTRDLDLMRAQLSDWIGRQVASSVLIADLNVPAIAGYSNETIFFRAAWHGVQGPRCEDLAWIHRITTWRSTDYSERKTNEAASTL
jgi:hypothetical protein